MYRNKSIYKRRLYYKHFLLAQKPFVGVCRFYVYFIPTKYMYKFSPYPKAILWCVYIYVKHAQSNNVLSDFLLIQLTENLSNLQKSFYLYNHLPYLF